MEISARQRRLLHDRQTQDNRVLEEHTSVDPGTRTNNPSELAWILVPLADDERRMNLEFKHHGTMNLERLKDYVSASDKSGSATLPDFNLNPLVNHLNTVIFKSLPKDVFSTSSHRFYFKNGHELLDNSRSLCIMRGYDYTVKSAMEKVLLNVNAATSAFFRPITIAEFLVACTTFATNEVGKRIKRLKVYIVLDRKSVQDPEEQKRVDNLNLPQNRIKTIKAFGKPIGDRFEQRLKFRKWIEVNGQLQQSTQWTHVVDHMRTVFGHQHPFNKELDAVNVGSDADPVWYPQEFLRIVPYQLYKNLLPDKLVEYMLELACKEPNEVRARIEAEGLMGLGVLQENGLQPFVNFPYLPSTEETQKNMWDKCNALSIKPNMLQIPSTRKPQVHIHYTGFHTQPNMDAKVQWNLVGRVKFLETPASNLPLKYYMIVGPDVTDDHILKTYQTVIDSSIQKYDVGTGTTCLETGKLPDYRKERSKYQEYQGGQKGVNSTYLVAKTHEDLKKDIKEAIELCRERKPGGQLVVLLLNNAQIPAYSAFKDVADRVSGLQSLCLTTSKNRGRSANDNALG